MASVQQQLGELAFKNSQIVEQYNQAQIAFDKAQAAAKSAEHDAQGAEKAYNVARQRLVVSATSRYESGGFSATGAFLSSGGGSNYLDQLQTLSMISTHDQQVLSSLTGANAVAVESKQKADRLFTEATAKRGNLVKQKNQTQAQIGKYETLLGTLTAAQQQAYQTAAYPAASPAAVSQAKAQIAVSPVTHGAAAKAVQYALNQVGKPYVYGAAGPDAFDCSGLTQMAWAAAGVSLPHSAAGQYGMGTQVAFGQLQPGDLMFFYQPIEHVTIYIGDGLMISAPQSGELVKVMPASAMMGIFTGATRLAS